MERQYPFINNLGQRARQVTLQVVWVAQCQLSANQVLGSRHHKLLLTSNRAQLWQVFSYLGVVEIIHKILTVSVTIRLLIIHIQSILTILNVRLFILY